jgi:hypothetical protein
VKGVNHSAIFFFAARLALVAAAIFCVFADGFFAFFSPFGFAFGWSFSLRNALSGSKFTCLPPDGDGRPVYRRCSFRFLTLGFTDVTRRALAGDQGKSILRSSMLTASTRTSTRSPRR